MNTKKQFERREFIAIAASASVVSLTSSIISPVFAQNTSPERIDNITPATQELKNMSIGGSSKTLIIAISLHHNNTQKIAEACANVFDIQVVHPDLITPDDLQKYELIGFGSGIYDQKHHQSILSIIDNAPTGLAKKTFIFSTSGISRNFAEKNSLDDPHTVLRKKLLEKGCKVLGEFNCVGWNTNSFLKFFGGLNRGRPNEKDCANAGEFARDIVRKM